MLAADQGPRHASLARSDSSWRMVHPNSGDKALAVAAGESGGRRLLGRTGRAQRRIPDSRSGNAMASVADAWMRPSCAVREARQTEPPSGPLVMLSASARADRVLRSPWPLLGPPKTRAKIILLLH